MPEDGYYFCGKACLQKLNASVLDAARLECREPEDPEPFGPEHGEDWLDWLVDNPNKWFPLCPRPGGEVQLADDFEEEPSENETDPAPKDPARDTQTPPQYSGALAALMQEGAHIQESFRMGDTNETGAWFGGLVGSMINGRVAVGLDDGDLVTRTKAELDGLYSMGYGEVLRVHAQLWTCSRKNSELASWEFLHDDMRQGAPTGGCAVGKPR